MSRERKVEVACILGLQIIHQIKEFIVKNAKLKLNLCDPWIADSHALVLVWQKKTTCWEIRKWNVSCDYESLWANKSSTVIVN